MYTQIQNYRHTHKSTFPTIIPKYCKKTTKKFFYVSIIFAYMCTAIHAKRDIPEKKTRHNLNYVNNIFKCLNSCLSVTRWVYIENERRRRHTDKFCCTTREKWIYFCISMEIPMCVFDTESAIRKKSCSTSLSVGMHFIVNMHCISLL